MPPAAGARRLTTNMITAECQIIVHRDHRHWSAWFADAPDEATCGTSPRHALERLLFAHPERGLTLDSLIAEAGWERGRELRYLAPARRICPDCRGSGTYIGLQAVDECRTCLGNRLVGL